MKNLKGKTKTRTNSTSTSKPNTPAPLVIKKEDRIEQMLARIVEGLTYRQIALEFGIALTTLHRYLNIEEHSARTREALAFSAAQYADRAEEVLIEAEASKEELMRARELAQHYRWKASKRDQQTYGDRQRLDVESNATIKVLSVAVEIIACATPIARSENDDV